MGSAGDTAEDWPASPYPPRGYGGRADTMPLLSGSRIRWPLLSLGVRAEAPESWCAFLGNPPIKLLERGGVPGDEPGPPSGIVLERAMIRETPTCFAEINRDGA